MRLIITSIFYFLTLPAYTATCSCAGIPLLNSLDTASAEKNKWYFSAGFEQHDMSDLVSGSKDVSDQTGRQRDSQSMIVQASYGITDQYSVSTLLSYVKHHRKIGLSSSGSQNTSGPSDMVIIAKYSPVKIDLFNRNEYSIGGGFRLPIGNDDIGNGINISEDLQPGTGALSYLFWSYWGHSFNQAGTKSIFITGNYSINEENNRDYSFGDEFNISTGYVQHLPKNWALGTTVRYRNTEADTRKKDNIPNTGGSWWDFLPSAQYQLTDKTALKLSGRIPISRNLDGTLQFTTSYSYSFTISHAL